MHLHQGQINTNPLHTRAHKTQPGAAIVHAGGEEHSALIDNGVEMNILELANTLLQRIEDRDVPQSDRLKRLISVRTHRPRACCYVANSSAYKEELKYVCVCERDCVWSVIKAAINHFQSCDVPLRGGGANVPVNTPSSNALLLRPELTLSKHTFVVTKGRRKKFS